MADNVAITAGSGTSVATDEIGGNHYQRVKPVIGADGTAVDVSAGAGAVGTGVQRMTLASDDPAVAALASVLAKIIAAPATAANQSTIIGHVDGIEALLAAATPAGTNLIGKVGIDQTTDGTTNKVNIDASLKSGTATRSTVNSGTSSVTILASNANRKGGVIYNSDANDLHLDLSGGTAVVATRCQVKLTTGQTYEIPAGSTTAITGIWAADGSGIADVVEYI